MKNTTPGSLCAQKGAFPFTKGGAFPHWAGGSPRYSLIIRQ